MMTPLVPLSARRRRFHVASHSRRGMILAVCLITLPIALAAFLLVFARVDVAAAESRRHQQRVQARLLAESALAVIQSKSGGKPVEGRIEGIGGYKAARIERDGRRIISAQGRPSAATGLTNRAAASSTAPRIVAEITARAADSHSRFEVLESRTFAEMPDATPPASP